MTSRSTPAPDVAPAPVTDRPMPFVTRVSPPWQNRDEELAQAFREAVAAVHEARVQNPHPLFKKHRDTEDADYNCDHGWCLRMWAMVREAEARAMARGPEPSR